MWLRYGVEGTGLHFERGGARGGHWTVAYDVSLSFRYVKMVSVRHAMTLLHSRRRRPSCRVGGHDVRFKC